VAVTGTNGKTTTVRLIAHIMKSVGKKVGYTTSDGIYVQSRMVQKGDCSGPKSSEFVLMDPTVDFAVLECARGGMLRSGLGFNHCDIGIVTNVAEDHLGLKGINTIEQLARVKSVVPQTVTRDGYAILNADDELVVKMTKDLDCKIALFSMNEKNPVIRKHCENGGIAAIYENSFVTIKKGGWKTRIETVANIPLTFSGAAVFMIQNILPAVLSGFLQNVRIEELRQALQTFVPSPTQTPGRMNLFEFENFKVMLDFAHNPAGLKAVGNFLERVNATRKIGIISGTGDRRDKDIIEFGHISASYFDEIVIRQDKHLRGRTAEEIVDLLIQGIKQNNDKLPINVILDEKEAITTTLQNAPQGSFITVLCDTIPDALNVVTKMKEKDQSKIKVLKADIPNLN
jgi:cyanophycin synthetase